MTATSEKRRAYFRAYYAANRERIRAQQRARWPQMRDAYTARKRAWARENREAVRLCDKLGCRMATARALLANPALLKTYRVTEEATT